MNYWTEHCDAKSVLPVKLECFHYPRVITMNFSAFFEIGTCIEIQIMRIHDL